MKTKQQAFDWWKTLKHIEKKQVTDIYFNWKREYSSLKTDEILTLYLEFT